MINTCLIGFGYWGPNLARNFIGSGKYKINCICDKNLSKLNAAKKIYPNINIYKDYKKYNSEIDQDRNQIYFKAQPGKLNSELNKIFLNIKDNKS